MKWFVKAGSNFRGIVDTDVSNLPKKAFKQVYIPDGYVDILKMSVVMSKASIHGENMLGFVSPVSNEVDSMEEFQYIDYQLKMRGSLLRDYLDRGNEVIWLEILFLTHLFRSKKLKRAIERLKLNSLFQKV